MRKFFIMLSCFITLPVVAGVSVNVATTKGGGLDEQLQKTKKSCGGISTDLASLKSMAGIGTIATGAGTVAGGVALGTGLAKSSVDTDVAQLEKSLKKLEEKQSNASQQYDTIMLSDDIFRECPALVEAYGNMQSAELEQSKIQSQIDAKNDKSKSLGNVRTGAMGVAAVTDTVGTVLAANNRVDGALQSKIDSCLMDVKKLKDAYNVARGDGSADAETMQRVDNIVRACGEWEHVDLSSINKKATGATISGGTGAVLALAGLFTSASANSDSVRNNDSDEGREKEKNLNTAANVLAGGTTIASAVSTVFNATQISSIKKAADVATTCEEALQ